MFPRQYQLTSKVCLSITSRAWWSSSLPLFLCHCLPSLITSVTILLINLDVSLSYSFSCYNPPNVVVSVINLLVVYILSGFDSIAFYFIVCLRRCCCCCYHHYRTFPFFFVSRLVSKRNLSNNFSPNCIFSTTRF